MTEFLNLMTLHFRAEFFVNFSNFFIKKALRSFSPQRADVLFKYFAVFFAEFFQPLGNRTLRFVSQFFRDFFLG